MGQSNLTAADLAVIAADVAAIIAEYPQTVAFRRGDTVLPEQKIRIMSSGFGSRYRSEAAAELRGQVTVLGASDLDIKPEDRFTHEGVVYRVTAIHVDRRAFTQARADMVQR